MENEIFAIGTKRRGELVRYDMKSRQFLPFLSGISATDPTFSKDGKWVAYLSYPDHTLWRSRADGNRLHAIDLSSDGSGLSFSLPGREDGRVLLAWRELPSQHGGWSATTNSREKLAIAPNWSPDGNFLVFDSRIEGKQADQIGMFELHIFDLRTGKVSVVPSSEGKMGALWATQNTLVAATDDRTKFPELRSQDARMGGSYIWLLRELVGLAGSQVSLLHDRRRGTDGRANSTCRPSGRNHHQFERPAPRGGFGCRKYSNRYRAERIANFYA